MYLRLDKAQELYSAALATRTSEYGLLHWAGILHACRQQATVHCGAWINGHRLRGAESARLTHAGYVKIALWMSDTPVDALNAIAVDNYMILHGRRTMMGRPIVQWTLVTQMVLMLALTMLPLRQTAHLKSYHLLTCTGFSWPCLVMFLVASCCTSNNPRRDEAGSWQYGIDDMVHDWAHHDATHPTCCNADDNQHWKQPGTATGYHLLATLTEQRG